MHYTVVRACIAFAYCNNYCCCVRQDFAKFWPDEGDFKEYKNFGMALISESRQSSHVFRDFLLQSTQVRR